MVDTVKWVKPNGTIIALNTEQATIEKATELGWKPEEVKKPKPTNPKKKK